MPLKKCLLNTTNYSKSLESSSGFFCCFLFSLPELARFMLARSRSVESDQMHGHPFSPDFMKMCFTSLNTDNPSMETQPLANTHQTRVTAATHPESFQRLPGSQSELPRSSRMEDSGSERLQRNSGQHVKHGPRESVYFFSTSRQSFAHLIPLQGQTRKLLSFITRLFTKINNNCQNLCIL